MMKIELFSRKAGMFQKTDSSNSAEIWTGKGDNITIVLLNGTKKPTPVAHITLNRGELMASLNFSKHAESWLESEQDSDTLTKNPVDATL